MIILGIDPGTAIVGYSVIEKDGSEITVKDYGCIFTKKEIAMPYRLMKISSDLKKLIKKYKPDEMAVEDLFFFKNLKTAVTVSQARGVIIVAGVQSKISVFEYTPLQVKQAVCGYGKASKMQVQQMVKMVYNLKQIPKPDDAADALAVAYCHANTLQINRRSS